MSPFTPSLCPHRQNPKACLECYHAGVNARPREMPKPKSTVPNTLGVVEQVRRAQMAALAKTADGTAQQIARDMGVIGMSTQADVEPTVRPEPVHLGYKPDGTKIEPPKAEPFRGPMPKPVLAPEQRGEGGQQSARVEPYSHSKAWHDKTVTIGGTKVTVQVPGKHQSLIDRLPRHPNAGDGVVRR